MEIKTFSYKRINNLGNYSSEHMEMFAELDSDDDVDQCAAQLKIRVETALGLNQPEPKPEPVAAPKPKINNYEENPF